MGLSLYESLKPGIRNIQTLLWAWKWWFKGEHGQTWESEHLFSIIFKALFTSKSLLSIITVPPHSPITTQILTTTSDWILRCVSRMFYSWMLYSKILFCSLNAFPLNVFLPLLIQFWMEWAIFLTVQWFCLSLRLKMGDRLNYITDAGFSLLNFPLALCIKGSYSYCNLM